MRYWLFPLSLFVSALANSANSTGELEDSAHIQSRTVTTAHHAQREAVGISYMLTLGHLPRLGLSPPAGFLSEFSNAFAGDVVFAAGRGRVDVVEIDQAVAATDDKRRGRLAGVGDYYLFDRTGFILVRPATRTFSSHEFTEASYTRNRSTENVPFARFDQVAKDSMILTQHAPVDVYWHADNASGHVIEGHIATSDTPLRELSVIASFGATLGLANIVSSDGTVPSEIVTVTAAAHFDVSGDDRARRNIITRHMMWGLGVAEIDLSRLVLPDDFTEAEWPGFEGRAGVPPLSDDGGARWRTMPGVQR